MPRTRPWSSAPPPRPSCCAPCPGGRTRARGSAARATRGSRLTRVRARARARARIRVVNRRYLTGGADRSWYEGRWCRPPYGPPEGAEPVFSELCLGARTSERSSDARAGAVEPGAAAAAAPPDAPRPGGAARAPSMSARLLPPPPPPPAPTPPPPPPPPPGPQERAPPLDRSPR